MRMGYVYICNTADDYISKVNTDGLSEQKKLMFTLENDGRIGPHGICVYEDYLLVANNYNNSLSLFDIKTEKEVSRHYIGIHCNDVAIYRDMAYITCGESNNVVLFNIKKGKIIEEIPCGNQPHSISLLKEKSLALVTNMQSDSITLIDCENREIKKDISVGYYPTKAIFTIDGQNIIVCESNLGSYFTGSISIISVKTLKIINRIIVGKYPVDMFCNERYLYVSNFGEGTVSVIDLSTERKIKKINVGGMPRGIIKYGRFLYAGDNYNNVLIIFDMINETKKIIPIGGEPTGICIST
jgi:YVTN family beta-propeller protein